VKKHIESIP